MENETTVWIFQEIAASPMTVALFHHQKLVLSNENQPWFLIVMLILYHMIQGVGQNINTPV